MFLDIQTLGVTEPGQSTNNISLSAKPCIIYFEASNGKYTMKNVNGTYAQQAGGDRHWNAVIGTTAYEWAFADSDSDGAYTIARTDGKFIKMDNATNGAPLYCNLDTGFEFALVAYSDLIRGKYTLKTQTDTYLGWVGGSAKGLVDDGVYTIQGDVNGQRGYMVAGEGFEAYPVLSGITLSDYTQNSVEAIENGKNWYVTTKVDGTYIYNIGLRKFLVKSNNNTVDFSDTPYVWNIVDNNGFQTIYDPSHQKYLSMGCGRTAANRPIAYDTNADDGGAKHTLTSVQGDFTKQIEAVEAKLSSNKVLKFQSTASQFYVTPSANVWFMEDVNNADSYIGFGQLNDWDPDTNLSLWTICKTDVFGFANIARANDNSKNLGSDANTNSGISANRGKQQNGKDERSLQEN